LDLPPLATLPGQKRTHTLATSRSSDESVLTLCDSALMMRSKGGDSYRGFLESLVGAAHAPTQHTLEHQRPLRSVGALDDVNLPHSSLPELADNLRRSRKVLSPTSSTPPLSTNNDNAQTRFAEGPGRDKTIPPAVRTHLHLVIPNIRALHHLPIPHCPSRHLSDDHCWL